MAFRRGICVSIVIVSITPVYILVWEQIARTKIIVATFFDNQKRAVFRQNHLREQWLFTAAFAFPKHLTAFEDD